jgi:hypothetical protein
MAKGKPLQGPRGTGKREDYQIPLGSTAQIAILTHHWHHIALLRRILLRIRSLENYVFLEGH